jgi:hypothetical protein
MAVFKLSFAGLAMGLRPRLRLFKSPVSAPSPRRGDPLPPILALEGDPDRTIRAVIDDTAARLGATVASFDRLSALARDPDVSAVVGVVLTLPRGPRELAHALEQARGFLGGRPVVVLAPQPLSPGLQDLLPLGPAFVAPPLTAERILFALDIPPLTHA